MFKLHHKGLQTLDQLTGGRRPAAPAAGVTSIAQLNASGQPRPLDRPQTHHGSPAFAACWLSLCAFGVFGILQGGGGQWILLVCLGALGTTRQLTNVAEISGLTLFLRDGLVGQYTTLVPCRQIQTLWISQGALGRLLGLGRVGLTTREGTTVWTPLISDPVRLKNTLIELAANRRPLWLPPEDNQDWDDR